MFLKRLVTGARALIKNDLASSVFPERSFFDLGLDGGLGGLSMVRDVSSAEDATTLVLDEPALILPLFSRKGDSDVRLRRRLEPGLVCFSSSSSLLDEFDEFESLLALELELPSSFSLFPAGDLEPLLSFSDLEEPLVPLLSVDPFDPLDGILSRDALVFRGPEDSDGTA